MKSSHIVKLLASLVAIYMCLITMINADAQANAQGRNISIVRDAEIEALMADYAGPLLGAANLKSRGVDVILVNDMSFNAFVSGRRIFINVGAILEAATPNEIIGVLAHEAGHLAGGHQERLRAQLDGSKTTAIVGMLLGVGAIVAGSTSGNEAGAAAGSAIISAAPQLAARQLLSYQRGEEINADRAALTYLNKTQQSPKGMLATFERFAQRMALAGVRPDPYRQSHPLPRERLSLLQETARQSPYFNKKDSQNMQLRHDLARAKIAAFSGGLPAIQRLFRQAPKSLPALYGQAVALDIAGRSKNALSIVQKLISAQASNPYFYELKGEIELKSRKAEQAAQSFAKAAQLDRKKSGLIQARLGFAYVATGQPKNAKKAITALKKGLQVDPDNFNAYRTLSSAYALSGDVAEAELAMAEGHFKAGNIRQSKIFAGRALQKLVPGKPSWQRAKDILTVNNKS